MVAGQDNDHRQAAPLPDPSIAPLGRLLELEKARMDIAKSKLADLKIKLTAHKTREEAARAHLDYLIASTSACQELYKAVEEDYQHAALCTALAEEAEPADLAPSEISEELSAVGAEGHTSAARTRKERGILSHSSATTPRAPAKLSQAPRPWASFRLQDHQSKVSLCTFVHPKPYVPLSPSLAPSTVHDFDGLS
ncbi:hypothetical protein BCV69DRAFT_294713 [Microstroma glucosiphilum]|uniref:Uncharacterized protein n=1 Tax=Pseudomicrostroma glucosiphilum TaxID=1684307 RepID=A0A316U437_9BASI|nr:hypothetical protein BCV69DRAFT_294713 [Pseudomicrostroma glucosiphilum]PWN19578.1 hypothetical protein BCV69DRAFT_294713 [Pseudomicrostroma glucosiphilum]